MFTVFEFFNDPLRVHGWFKSSDGSVFSMTIREIDIMPLLMEFISDFDGFVDIGIKRFHIISTELDLHTIGLPWPLETS
jgi:hypothetical protein